jgi:hypothetical protein
MPITKKRDVGRAWAHLNRSLGPNTDTAFKALKASRRRMKRLVR